MGERAEYEIPVGYPDFRDHAPLGRRNLVNVAVTLWVAVPPVVCALVLFRWFPAASLPADPGLAWPSSMDETAALLLHHPILAANLFFFLFVDIQFWVLALLQRSSWLIDPYWTLLPPLLAFFYLGHPLAEPDGTRAMVSTSILLVWSVRLTWNYFRRERWRFGYREWWSVAGFGAICGEPFFVVGTAFNSIVLAAVTVMTERRMRAVPERREAFEAYCRRTSVWIPWWPRRASEETV